MGFGRNPYVEKAEAALAKAGEARDVASEAMAYREAAHLWERAASKEKEGKRRSEYEANAEAAHERSIEAEDKPAPSAADLLAQLKIRRGGAGD
jgi:hypothetical protein